MFHGGRRGKRSLAVGRRATFEKDRTGPLNAVRRRPAPGRTDCPVENTASHLLLVTRSLCESRFPGRTYQYHSDHFPIVSVNQNSDSLGLPIDHPCRSRMDTALRHQRHRPTHAHLRAPGRHVPLGNFRRVPYFSGCVLGYKGKYCAAPRKVEVYFLC